MKTLTRRSLALVAGAVLVMTACSSGSSNGAPPPSSAPTSSDDPPSIVNAPWYPSLQAFEHYNSGRAHVFSIAECHGSFEKPNRVDLLPSNEGAYPSGYNMSYLSDKDAFIQGGSYGNVENSIGPFVAKVDPTTLKPVWYTQLV